MSLHEKAINKPGVKPIWLLIFSLIVFDIGCFVEPSLFDTFIASFDVRWWSFSWFLVLTGVLAVLYYRGVRRRHIALFGVILLVLAGTRTYTVLTRYYICETVIVRGSATMDYDFLIHFPKGYDESSERFPLIVCLHGAGEVGKDVTEIAGHDISRYASGRVAASNFPFVVAAPVTTKPGWEPEQVVHVVDTILDDARFGHRIDSSRIYLTGFSMGGFGTFRTACEFPDRFAAIIPLAGFGMLNDAAKLQTVPTWAFHGDADNMVSYVATKNMISTMKNQKHPNAKLTILYGAGHDIPGIVYTRTDLYCWLLKQKKETNRQ